MIRFGTDGWRARMDAEFTMENVELVAQAFSDYLRENVAKAGKTTRVAVGYDWRKNSENFARTFTEILVGNGIEVLLTDNACPTPAVSSRIVKAGCDAGIIVTASHNPPAYNGIKIKSSIGGSADKAVTDAVEKKLGQNPVRRARFASGNPKVEDFNAPYLEALKAYVRLDAIRRSPYRVLVDSMHGVGDHHIEHFLAGGTARAVTMRGDRDVTFGGFSPEPIPKNLTACMERMRGGDFDVAVVTDGDADRVGVIRPGGEFVSPGVVLSLILLHFVEDLKRTGSVVTTVSNTALIYKVARKLGLKVHETPVGFKYICEIMQKENVLIGGEESGGIGFQNYLYERDGLLSGLLLLEMMAMRGQSFEEILRGVEKEFGRLYYVRQDLDYPQELKAKLFDKLSGQPPQTVAGARVRDVQSRDGVKITFTDDSWLLFRLSGTEPILRIYAEAPSALLAERLVSEGKDFAFRV